MRCGGLFLGLIEELSVARILITSGPTRQYLDPVRYLTNASSGRMGCALAQTAIDAGHDVVLVSGPVEIEYPAAATLLWVTSTEEMLEVARREFQQCDGIIGVAAPCDYRPERVSEEKIAKTGDPLVIHLIETVDVIAALGAEKAHRWVVGFALETEDHRFRAITKAEKKNCDLMVLNSPSAMNATTTEVEVLDRAGCVLSTLQGPKTAVAKSIFDVVESTLIASTCD